MIDTNEFTIKGNSNLIGFNYDICNTKTDEIVGYAKEEEPSNFVKILRFMLHRTLLPIKIKVFDKNRNICFLLTKNFGSDQLRIYDQNFQYLGYLYKSDFVLEEGFEAFDHLDHRIAKITGGWKGKFFRIMDRDGKEIGSINKQWFGPLIQIVNFTCDYYVTIDSKENASLFDRMLIIGAVIGIDILFTNAPF